MGLYIASLNSGSNGNCYYVGNENEAVLIDVGISCRETEKRMKRLGLLIENVKAIFISHEHGDHISGVQILSKKYAIPVYLTTGTHSSCTFQLSPTQFNSFSAGAPVSIGALSITAFTKHHDAADPHSFIVSQEKICVGVFTDLGIVCKSLINHFKRCHAAFLEANYDELMLDQGSYPQHLKNRIRGGLGHLSNKQAHELVVNHRPAFMSHLLLSHLSKNNNDPDLVQQLFSEFSGSLQVIVASRYAETPVFHIEGSPGISAPVRTKRKAENIQLSLF